MSRLNVWAYKGDEFFSSARAPVCQDGNAQVWRAGHIRWDHPVAFNGLDDLVGKLERMVHDGEPGGQRRPVHTIGNLAILAHGQPGRIRIGSTGDEDRRRHAYLSWDNVELQYSRQLGNIHGFMDHGDATNPLVLFLSCAAAATAAGELLFTRISNLMRNTRVVGFTHLLTTDATQPVDLEGGRFCLAPSIRDTDEDYDPSRDITAQGGGGTAADAMTLPVASPDAPHAREWRNGSAVRRRRARRADATGFQSTQTHRGRGIGGPPRIIS